MAPAQLDPTELIAVTFIDSAGNRHEGVELPRHMLRDTVSMKARERYLVSSGEIPDPSAPELPPTVEDVIDQVRAEQVAADVSIAEQLRQQLDELQSRLDGQPLSHAELVSYREELAQFQRDAIAAQAQLVVIEGRGSQLRADLEAIVAPLNQQAAETARQQQENNEVQARVLDDLQAQSQALLEAVSQDAAAALVDVHDEAMAAANQVAITTARATAEQIASQNYGAGTTIVDRDPLATDAQSIGQMAFGRPLTSGDCVLYPGEDSLRFYRWNGDGWDQRAGEIVNRVVAADVKVAALDNSTKNTIVADYSTNVIGGGGGTGNIPLLVREVDIGGGGTWVPIAITWDWDIPSLFWGGDPTASNYDNASWDRKPYEARTFHCTIAVTDASLVGGSHVEKFTVERNPQGALSLAIYDCISSGVFNTPQFEGSVVSDVKLTELRRDFTVESNQKVGPVTGLQLELMFGPNGLTPRRVLISGAIQVLGRRRAGI